jgi:hypothetical protein
MTTVLDEPRTEETDEDLEGGELFDKSQYETEELALPKVDGEPVDRIAVKFSGTVFLDRSSAADVELIRALTLHSERTLLVEGKVSGKTYAGATDREGELDVVVQQVTVKVTKVARGVGE